MDGSRKLLTITVERGDAGLFYAMTNDGPPMLIGATTGVPEVLKNMAHCIEHMAEHHPEAGFGVLINTPDKEG